MHHFAYRRGMSDTDVLHAEEVDLSELAASVGTPFYCYSTATLERHYRVFADAFAGMHGTLWNETLEDTIARLDETSAFGPKVQLRMSWFSQPAPVDAVNGTVRDIVCATADP